MERQEIEIFLVLAQELHFGRTAERLHISTARVSKTLKKIERHLGVELFERTSRRVELTDVGARLRDDLSPHHQGIQDAMDRARQARHGITSTITAAFMSALAGRLVTQGGERFMADNPWCRVRVVETQVHQFVSQLRDGTADVLLMPLPVDEPDITVGPVLRRQDRYVVVPTGHHFADRTSVTFEDLADEVFPTAASAFPEYAADYHSPRATPSGRRIKRSAEVCSTHAEALTLVAVGGRNIVLGDAQFKQYYNRPDLAYIPVSDLPPLEFALLWRTRDDSDARIRAFVNATVEAESHAAPITDNTPPSTHH
ncbi:LysR family transcriptional regulator [Streptomyces narbonensis]|uniref:LysR family transcriptional regulator n=1 Tax=Streptomyces narbonensis TaxID=67333 RepID=UPI00167AC551|nr:LysR family transcriptional regulator [Streptomyces narbonensis]GGV98989.1 LysR family transcriptional regulator [Streptomyces narbonensis]